MQRKNRRRRRRRTPFGKGESKKTADYIKTLTELKYGLGHDEKW